MIEKMCIKCHKDNQWFRSEFCFSCMKKENENKLKYYIRSGEAEETEYEDDIICPWCGTRYEPFDVDERYSFMDEGEYTNHCYECNNDFVYQAEVSITFSTRRP